MVAAGHIPWQGLHLLRTAEGGRSEFKFIQGRHHPVGLGSSNQSPLSPSFLPASASVDPILSLKAPSAPPLLRSSSLPSLGCCMPAGSQSRSKSKIISLSNSPHAQSNGFFDISGSGIALT